MPGEPVGDGVQQDRAAALREDLLFTLEGIDNGQGVVAVDALGVHLLGVDARTDAGDELLAHRLTVGLATHTVEIVHAVEDDGQAAAQGLVPQVAVLVHAGECDALPHRAAAERGVPDVGHDDAGLAVGPLV